MLKVEGITNNTMNLKFKQGDLISYKIGMSSNLNNKSYYSYDFKILYGIVLKSELIKKKGYEWHDISIFCDNRKINLVINKINSVRISLIQSY